MNEKNFRSAKNEQRRTGKASPSLVNLLRVREGEPRTMVKRRLRGAARRDVCGSESDSSEEWFDDGTKDGNDSEDYEDEETDSDDTEDGDDYDSGDNEAYRPGPELFDQDDDDDVPLTTVMKKKQRGASSKMKQTASSSKGKGKEKVAAESAKEQRKRKKLELLDNKDLNDLVWVIAKSSTMAEYDANMDRMKRKSQDAWAFLNRNPAPFWSRAGFSHFSKSDALLNNYCEQLNSKLVKMRVKPIITMAEELRLYIVTKMNKERKKAAAYEDNKYEVECRPIKMIVDLGISSCTCNMWGLTGTPCEHAVACMAFKNVEPEDFVHQFFSVQLWRKTYEPYTSTVLPTPPPSSPPMSQDLSQSSQSTIRIAPTIPTSQNSSTSTMVFMPTPNVTAPLRPQLPITQPMAPTTVRPPPLRPASMPPTAVRPPPLRPASMPPIAVRPPPLRPASMYNETNQAACYATRSRLSKFMPPQPSNAGHE
ncbi:hypothetical protein G2W53_029055 [Senna tora]|uniref:SWIM-type domain-containing protein n=1 Tax=Senna tora TaxID=362788 RepID=A0A834T6H0_9FABA|nr:hypothetical protein G2W53_029055 [Senna tora]